MNWRTAALAVITSAIALSAPSTSAWARQAPPQDASGLPSFAPGPPPAVIPTPQAQAMAANVKPNTDLRCMLVANDLGHNPDSRAKQMGSLMMIFYLGRLDARSPGMDVGPAMAAQVGLLRASAPPPEAMKAEAERCISAFNKRMQVLAPQSAAPASGPKPAGVRPPAASPARK